MELSKTGLVVGLGKGITKKGMEDVGRMGAIVAGIYVTTTQAGYEERLVDLSVCFVVRGRRGASCRQRLFLVGWELGREKSRMMEKISILLYVVVVEEYVDRYFRSV